ncbi:hypothetical protein DRH29_01475 [candidate division Kazan bacterium]|uniref:DAGKc domain-containing protein n=1 Tax=candidate division Kazan bacterium TaxID=2202143 RepID=A0A420ZCX5_UNCK3|nr:MAG: hypothetical protein DRH29_01475 [candidate division Kazan bacterium]
MYLFLINPEAGNKRFVRIEKKMKQLLDQYKIKRRFVIIDDLANVPAIVKHNLRPIDKGIVIVGGNATVNAVINATVTENLPLAIVPMSRTNYLAKSIGIKSWEQAIKMLAEPEFRAERLGKIGKYYFVRQIAITSRQNLLTKYLTRTNPILRFLGIAGPGRAGDNQVTTKILLDDELSASSKTQKLEISLSPSQLPAGSSAPKSLLRAKSAQVPETDPKNRPRSDKEVFQPGAPAEGSKKTTEKKLQIRLFVPSQTGTNISLLHGNCLTIDSDKKMPVTMGNETIAFTPVEIKGLSKHVRLMVPKGSNGELTEPITS